MILPLVKVICMLVAIYLCIIASYESVSMLWSGLIGAVAGILIYLALNL